jgi:creatinine amidohydrolase
MRFKGTISIPGMTLKAVVEALCLSIFRHGGRKVVLLNSHGGNIPALSLTAQELNGLHPDCKVINLFWMQFIDQDEEMAALLDQEMGTHADEVETSAMLVFKEGLVRMGEAEREIPEAFLSGATSRMLRPLLSQGVLRLQDLTKTGVLGDPTGATKEKGEIIVRRAVEKGLEFILEGFRGVA